MTRIAWIIRGSVFLPANSKSILDV